MLIAFLGCVCVWAITAPQAFGFVLAPTGGMLHATAARGLPPAHRPATRSAGRSAVRMGLFDGMANKVCATARDCCLGAHFVCKRVRALSRPSARS
jgi:hypothetical protein